MLSYAHEHFPVSALIDSGAAINIIDSNLVEKFHLPTIPCTPPLRVTAVNNQPIGKEENLFHRAKPLELTFEFFHKEKLSFYVISSPANPIILGLPWLQLHDPHISWRNKELTCWSSQCFESCLLSAQPRPCLTTSIENPGTSTAVTLHREYSDLRYLLSPDGVEMDQAKEKAVTDWPEPTTVKELQPFLGFANFYRRFIRNYSTIAGPLTSLLRGKSKRLSWSESAREAFGKLKLSFTTAPILCQPDPESPFVVEVDASNSGIGAVLSQL
ncbi:hypothetical protein QTP70_035100 [Hemibagrus guttatus]|uniref:Reverse transcriptase/retrotransposon-derived protein RNase H-like domain-containing protein n=1 Tax=Hemibagrus guttatus TaxID=175788 RepID=A0AAE0PX50_9TELE|nr:hypothetical protein QTP70_035100 [Hemibagrus guttatus]KAK3527279.1 hypothetical protein QTP86_018610 [Hemibagrus guttatus]